MTQARTRPREQSQEKQDKQAVRARGRLLAEWVSLGISLLLILGVAGFLLYEALQPSPPYVPAQARALVEETRPQDDRYIMPVEVHNGGERTLREIKIELEYTSPDGKRETRDATLDYLGERSRDRVYFYFDDDPRGLHVQAKPVTYRVE